MLLFLRLFRVCRLKEISFQSQTQAIFSSLVVGSEYEGAWYLFFLKIIFIIFSFSG